jgi:hypothetical protein
MEDKAAKRREDGMPVGTPWGPDNPPPVAGRPRGLRNTKTVLAELLSIVEEARNPVTGETGEVNQHEMMLAKLVVMAKNGDLASVDRVLDRLEGKPTQKNEHSGPDGKPIQQEVVASPEAIAEAMKIFKEGL